MSNDAGRVGETTGTDERSKMVYIDKVETLKLLSYSEKAYRYGDLWAAGHDVRF